MEGFISVVIGIWAAFIMAPSPTQTKKWFRPKGWFTEREEKVLVNRILRDDSAKGGMHNRQSLNLKLIWEACKDFDLWPIYAIGLTFIVPITPAKYYLTLSLTELGFGTFETALLCIPPAIVTSMTVGPRIFSLIRTQTLTLAFR